MSEFSNTSRTAAIACSPDDIQAIVRRARRLLQRDEWIDAFVAAGDLPHFLICGGGYMGERGAYEFDRKQVAIRKPSSDIWVKLSWSKIRTLIETVEAVDQLALLEAVSS